MSTTTKDAAYGRLREGGLRPNARKNLKVAAFMAPILIFALLFVYYPFLKTLVNSLCAVNDKGEILRFVGLENFKYVFGRNDFKKALRNSIVITLINVPITLVLTISLALLATKKRKLSPVYETMFTHGRIHVGGLHDLQIHVQPDAGLGQRVLRDESGMV